MSYLLDTSTISFFLKNHDSVVKRMNALEGQGLFASVVTEGELIFGALRRGREGRQELLDDVVWVTDELVEILPVSSAVAKTYGRIRADVQRRGLNMSDNDLWIAATAMSAEMTLAATDHAFSRINGLDLEDWTIT